MKINKLTASFGKLNGDSLELEDGLNVICAPNESGKSTWCAFIRAMLYGIDSSERQKAGYLPDKLRYAPWSGAPMQGVMELEADGKNIVITRQTTHKNAPMRDFSSVYAGSSVPVEGLTGENAGEKLTGVSRDVFRRSAFVEQGGISVTGSPELEKRISSIVSSGDEGCSFSEADEQLRAWQRKRRYNRRGRLPELEDEMLKTKRKLDTLSSAVSEREMLTESLETAEAECRRLEEAVNESRMKARREALQRMREMREAINRANDAHEKADDARDAARAELCGCIIGEREPEEVRAELDADLAECRKLKAAEERKSSPVLPIVFFVLMIAAAVAGILIEKLIFIAAAVFAVVGAVLLVRCSRIKNAAHDAGKRRHMLLSKYRAQSEDDIRACGEEYFELYGIFAAAEAEERRTAELLAAARRNQEHNDASTLAELDFSGGDSEAARLGREYQAARRRYDEISSRLSELRGRMDGMGDPLVLGSELRRMSDEHDELQEEYDAIALALDALRSADAEIQSRFSPELGRLAAHYMSLVTDGKYDEIMLNRDFSALVHAEGDSIARDTSYLSAGTLDLLYLAVRLAVCALALPEGKSCPLILDDTLVNLDSERTEQAIKLLSEIAKERQVVLFTCKEPYTQK